MQAIQTRYLSPTNTKGARIKAWAKAGSVTISYPHELSGQACHRAAAEALARKFEWTGEKYGDLLGSQLINHDYVFVFNNEWARD